MTSILSMISGSFTRSLLLGTLFPVTVFALLGLLFVMPFLPADAALLAPIAQLEPAGKTLLVTLVVVVATGLLYNLNSVIVRLYQGYPWRHSYLGAMLTARQRRRAEWAATQRGELRELLQTLRALEPDHPDCERLEEWRTRVGHRATHEYPAPHLVLPTRLGNVIRSFEEYPRSVYGISTVSAWPRLRAVVDKDYAAVLDESKSRLDFMVNASFLSASLALCILLGGLLVPGRIAWAEWAAQITLPAVAANLFYRGAVSAAEAWGAEVKSAFDLFRWALLEKMGYKRDRFDAASEKELWEFVCKRMIFGNPPPGTPLMPYVLTSEQPPR